MPQFDVTIDWYRSVTISVEADTEEDAGSLAWGIARSENETLHWENNSFEIQSVELMPGGYQ